MKKAIIIHGWASYDLWSNPDTPSSSNFAFIPWLSKQLIIRGIHTIAPEMPNSYEPNYEIWKKELERFELDEDTILIGWSCGGGFLVRYLSENNIKINKLVLMAPWIGTLLDGNDGGDQLKFVKSFFDFTLDENLFAKTVNGVYLLKAEMDDDVVWRSIDILENKLENVKVSQISNSGKHFHNLEQPDVLKKILEDES